MAKKKKRWFVGFEVHEFDDDSGNGMMFWNVRDDGKITPRLKWYTFISRKDAPDYQRALEIAAERYAQGVLAGEKEIQADAA